MLQGGELKWWCMVGECENVRSVCCLRVFQVFENGWLQGLTHLRDEEVGVAVCSC